MTKTTTTKPSDFNYIDTLNGFDVEAPEDFNRTLNAPEARKLEASDYFNYLKNEETLDISKVYKKSAIIEFSDFKNKEGETVELLKISIDFVNYFKTPYAGLKPCDSVKLFKFLRAAPRDTKLVTECLVTFKRIGDKLKIDTIQVAPNL